MAEINCGCGSLVEKGKTDSLFTRSQSLAPSLTGHGHWQDPSRSDGSANANALESDYTTGGEEAGQAWHLWVVLESPRVIIFYPSSHIFLPWDTGARELTIT